MANPDCYPLGAGGCFHGVKVPGYSPPSSADVMNEWSYAVIPPTYLHRKNRCGMEWNLLIHVTGLCTVHSLRRRIIYQNLTFPQDTQVIIGTVSIVNPLNAELIPSVSPSSPNYSAGY